MRRLLFGLPWLAIATLVIHSASWADRRKPNHPPAQHPDFTLLESSLSHALIRYERRDFQSHVTPAVTVYTAIPIGADYTISPIAWRFDLASRTEVYESFEGAADPAGQASREQDLLNGSIRAKRMEYQELDVLALEVLPNAESPESSSAPAHQRERVSLHWMEFEVRWDDSDAPKPEAAAHEDAGYARLFRNLFINGVDAPQLRRKRAMSESEIDLGFAPRVIGYDPEASLVNSAFGAIIPRPDGLRIQANGRRVQVIRPPRVAETGLDPATVDLNQLRLWHRGEEQRIAVLDVEGNGLFNEEDAIYFYASDSDSEFTAYSQYFLTWSPMESEPLRAEVGEWSTADAGKSVILASEIHDDQSILYQRGVNQFGWTHRRIDDVTTTIPLDLVGLASEGEVRLTLEIENRTRGQCGFLLEMGDAWKHFSLQINQATSIQFIAPASEALKTKSVTMILDREPDPLSAPTGISARMGDHRRLYIHRIEVVYPRTLHLTETPVRLESQLETPTALTVTPDRRKRESEVLSAWVIRDAQIIARHSMLDPTMPVALNVPGGEWDSVEIHYERELFEPYWVGPSKPSTLRHRNQGHDYVMIAHRDLIDAVRPLAQRRINDGFEVLLTDVQSIYDEFNYGYPEFNAIKRFLRYGQSQWRGRSPEFVVFVGDSSWDLRDREGTGFENQVPTYAPLDNPQHDGSDEWYAYLWGGENDAFADLIMGRISVRTPREVSSYLKKVELYETESPVGVWKARNLVITDDGFERYSVELASSSLPEMMYSDAVNQIEFPHVTNSYLYHRFINSDDPSERQYLNAKFSPECTLAIIDAFDQGALLAQYIGHGGNQLWSHERIFYGTDRPTSNVLELQANTRFPFIMNWSCLTGYLNYNRPPFHVCLAEEFIRYADRGGIAVWAPSGGGTTDQHMIMSHLVMRNLLRDGLTRFGEATSFTKTEYLQVSYSRSLTDQYILFGDPAIEIAKPSETLALVTSPEHYIAGAAQPFSVSSTVEGFAEGLAVVLLSVNGSIIYESFPLDIQDGRIEHEFTALTDESFASDANLRVYAWNDELNLDAWGGVRLPRYSPEVQLVAGIAEVEIDAATVTFEIFNNSGFDAQPFICQLLALDEVIEFEAPGVPSGERVEAIWQGELPQDAPFVFVHIPAQVERGLPEMRLEERLPIQIKRTFAPIVPLTGHARFTSRDLITEETLRLRVPFRNVSEATAWFEVQMNGPGVHDQVRDATLTPGEERSFEFPLTLPEPGEVEYTIVGRGRNFTREDVITAEVLGKPDLALAEGGYSIRPDQPIIGHTVYITVEVYNIGDGPANDIKVDAFLGDPKDGVRLSPFHNKQQGVISRLEPGEQTEVELVWDPEAYKHLGSHQITVVVDPTNRISELDETNNQIVLNLTMLDLPDLAVDPWTDHRLRLVEESELPVWGTPVRLTGRVRNIGDSDATYVRLSFMHNDEEYTRFLDRLRPGAITETYVEVPLTASRNTYALIADKYDLIAEKNETADDLGNNLSRTKRYDFDIQMPVAPIEDGVRVYVADSKEHFTAGKMEFLYWHPDADRLEINPNILEFRHRIIPEFVLDESRYTMGTPSGGEWRWSAFHNNFVSPIRDGGMDLQVELPIPQGEYDVSVALYSQAYDRGATSEIQIKIPNAEFQTIVHGQGGGENGFYPLGRVRLNSDVFPVDFKPVEGAPATVISDVRFSRANPSEPLTAVYYSPYLPTPGVSGPAVISWDSGVPDGASLSLRARWVRVADDGAMQFSPWARTTPANAGELTLSGRGDYIQYGALFTMESGEYVSPWLKRVVVKIPCQDAPRLSRVGR